MISMSALASPGRIGALPVPLQPASANSTSEPSSSAKQVDGRRKTSVWIFVGSTSLYSPWFCQKLEVSVASGSMTTRYLSFDRPSISFPLFGNRGQRIEALAEVAVDLALLHQLEHPQDVVDLVDLRQIVVAPVVLLRRGRAVPGLHEADEELGIVLPVVHLAGPQRLGRALARDRS